MKAIFKHELSSYFTGLIGYIFGAFLLLFAGIFTMVYNLNYQVADFKYALQEMVIVFLLAIPVLTMRVLAEERRQKTDQLLYSLPISMKKVVLGKYLAMIVLIAIPVLIIALYPLILSAYGNMNLAVAYGTLLAFFLLGAALAAMGMFISAMTESQPLAAGACFVVMLLNYFISGIADSVSATAIGSYLALIVVVALFAVLVWLMTKSWIAAVASGGVLGVMVTVVFLVNSSAFEGLFPAIMRQMSLFERFYGFIGGVVDLTSFVYFLSVIAMFLFLTVQSLEKRRWSE
jgi:ABC-2 type transport system permease protein